MSLLVAGCQGLIVSLRTKPTWPSRLCVFLLPSLSCPYIDVPRIAVCCSRTQQCHGGVCVPFFSRFLYQHHRYRLQIYTPKSLRCKKKTRFISSCYGGNITA